MTRRKKNKQEAIERHYWKKLMRRYPFLRPRTHWYTGRILSKKQKKNVAPWMIYDLPIGWVNKFMIPMCEEIRAELIRCNYLDKYYLVQVKEKYGEMCIYDSGIPKNCKVDEIINKYSYISQSVCTMCGDLDTPMTYAGWQIPLCRKCFDNNKRMSKYYDYDSIINKEDNPTTPEIMKWRVYSDGGWTPYELDISDTVNMLRNTKVKKIRYR